MDNTLYNLVTLLQARAAIANLQNAPMLYKGRRLKLSPEGRTKVQSAARELEYLIGHVEQLIDGG